MSFFALISTFTLTNIIDIVNFKNVIIVIRVFVIAAIDFFIENIVLNINVLDFSSYSAR